MQILKKNLAQGLRLQRPAPYTDRLAARNAVFVDLVVVIGCGGGMFEETSCSFPKKRVIIE
ncbi:hypothetical protein, partial [uncultured Pseudacidovorax sp.]|uniref:hypothetical protein n=1 Tax=uncultured Pseudacidovorax sp. TaxID=679313 RepID=UPI0025FBC45B